MPDLIHKTYGEASASLRNPELIRSPQFQRARIDWPRATDQLLAAFLVPFLRELHNSGFPLRPYEIERGEERQNLLRKQGKSRARFGQSAHNFGLAVDVAHYSRGWQLSRYEWDLVGAVGKEVARKRKLKIEWGGDWSFYDPAHWEIADWRALVKQPSA